MKLFLKLTAVYLILDGAIHLLNLRLYSVSNIWPKSAVSYASLLNMLYASFVFLAAILLFLAQKDMEKYKSLLFASAIWALFHSLLLLFLTLSHNFTGDFSNLPSLYFWLPFYNQYLLLEVLLSFFYGITVILWRSKSG